MARNLTIRSTRRTQVLESGITIRQDFREAVRFVFFETGQEEYPYASPIGTAFIVNYRNRCYGLTANHVRQNFSWKDLIITDQKIGAHKALIRAVYYPSSPCDEAIGSDVMDLTAIEFVDGIDSEFFKGSAYIIDRNTVGSSKRGHRLQLNGVLKEKSEIIDDIAPTFALLRFADAGLAGSDPALRMAVAQYADRQFDSIAGVSGAPVYDETANRLCGMALRGGADGELWRIRFLDIFDIMQFLEAVHGGKMDTYYRKTLTRLVKTPIADLPIIGLKNE